LVSVDDTNKRLAFDRPIMSNYTVEFASAGSVDEATPAAFYAYVTKGLHVGFSLVLGSRGGVRGKVMQPIQFYNPVPVDDFESVWRFSYDEIVGYKRSSATTSPSRTCSSCTSSTCRCRRSAVSANGHQVVVAS
jgi:hypothetical protein